MLRKSQDAVQNDYNQQIMKRLFLLAVLLLTFGGLSAQSIEELEARAAKGDVEAQVALADYYFDGENTDFAKAAEWYMKAAQQNNPKAQFGLGYCYFLGAGIKPNMDEALVWFRRAAEQGNALANSYLGFLYMRGIGMQCDYDVAVQYLMPAAEVGDAEAQYSLALCYFNGLGVERSDEEAMRWVALAAEGGHAEAKKIAE